MHNYTLFDYIYRGVFGHLAEPLPWALCDEYALRGVEELVGAHEGEVALMNGLSVNLHIMMVRNNNCKLKFLLKTKLIYYLWIVSCADILLLSDTTATQNST